jgi:hypothetical protein
MTTNHHAAEGKAAALPFRVLRIEFLLAGLVGVIAGVLGYLASHSVPSALLDSSTAAGSFAQLFVQVMGTLPEPPASDQDETSG